MKSVSRNNDVLWRVERDSEARAMDALTAGEDVGDIGTSILFLDGSMLSLNLLGTEIWKLCDGRSVEDIIATLHERYEVEEKALREDVLAFLNDLAAKGFVTDGGDC